MLIHIYDTQLYPLLSLNVFEKSQAREVLNSFGQTRECRECCPWHDPFDVQYDSQYEHIPENIYFHSDDRTEQKQRVEKKKYLM